MPTQGLLWVNWGQPSACQLTLGQDGGVDSSGTKKAYCVTLWDSGNYN